MQLRASIKPLQAPPRPNCQARLANAPNPQQQRTKKKDQHLLRVYTCFFAPPHGEVGRTPSSVSRCLHSPKPVNDLAQITITPQSTTSFPGVYYGTQYCTTLAAETRDSLDGPPGKKLGSWTNGSSHQLKPGRHPPASPNQRGRDEHESPAPGVRGLRFCVSCLSVFLSRNLTLS